MSTVIGLRLAERETPGVIRGRLSEPAFVSAYAEQMYRLRYQVFHERLRWDVQVRDGLEVDQFDDPDSVYLLTTAQDHQAVSGGWRLRPTTRPYMLSHVFPQLLNGVAVPCHPRVWEISRFAVDTSETSRTAGFSLGGSARRLLRDAVSFAVEHGVSQYVLVVSVAVERLIASSGVIIHRYGSPVRIGRVMTVAGWVDIDAHTRHVILGEEPLRAAA